MSFCCGWLVAVLWGGGGGFCGGVGWSVFLSLLGWGLAGVLPLGFLAGGCGCGRFCGEVLDGLWAGDDSPSFCLVVNRYLLI